VALAPAQTGNNTLAVRVPCARLDSLREGVMWTNTSGGASHPRGGRSPARLSRRRGRDGGRAAAGVPPTYAGERRGAAAETAVAFVTAPALFAYRAVRPEHAGSLAAVLCAVRWGTESATRLCLRFPVRRDGRVARRGPMQRRG